MKKNIFLFFSIISCFIINQEIYAKAYAPYIDIENWSTAENGCPWEFHTDCFGNCLFKERNWRRNNTFLAITTSAGLPEQCEDEIYHSITEWNDFILQMKNDYSFNVYLAYSHQLQETYGEDAKYYLVTIDPFRDTPYTDCRNFNQIHDEVIDTLLLEENLQGECYWSGTYTFATNSTLTNEIVSSDMTAEEIKATYPTLFGNDTILENSKENYQEWKEKYNAYIVQNQDTTKSQAEKMSEMAILGIRSPFSVTMEACETADNFYKTYHDKISVAFPDITVTNGVDECRTFSACEHVGDLNEDNSIDASDAAKILIVSANQGVGNNTGLSKEEEQFADINADYEINAVDAALVLQYSASTGCGIFSGTLAEFIKSKS